MSRHIRLIVIAIASSTTSALAQGGGVNGGPGGGSFCANSNLDNTCDDDGTTSEHGHNKSDPVGLVDGNTVLKRKDLELRGSLSTMKLIRSFTSDYEDWNTTALSSGLWTNLSGIPPPFGPSPAQAASLNWWHNYFSYVDPEGHSAPSGVIVRNINGRATEFGDVDGGVVLNCGSSPCWFPQGWMNTTLRQRLRQDGSGASVSGYTYMTDDGTQYGYSQRFRRDAGTVYFLDHVANRNGQIIASVHYAPPIQADGGLLSGCVNGIDAGTDPGVPYVSSVTNEDNGAFIFYYRMVNGSCVIDSVAARAPNTSGAATQVQYSYTADGTFPQITAAQTPHGSQAYSYQSATFSEVVSGQTTFSHQFGGDPVCPYGVSVVTSPIGSSNITYGVTGHTSCANINNAARIESVTSAGRGDGLAGAPGLQTQYDFLMMGPCGPSSPCYEHGVYLQDTSTSTCSPMQSCAAGPILYNLDTSSPPGRPLGYIQSITGKRGYSDLTPAQFPATSPSYPLASEPAGLQRGAPIGTHSVEADGTCLGYHGDCEWYSYIYGTDTGGFLDRRLPSTTSRASLLINPGSAGEQTSWNRTANTNTRTSTLKQGVTRDISGTSNSVTKETFYFTSSSGGSNCRTQSADPLNRPLEVHGPCFSGGTGATDCSSSPYPLTQYEYWPTTDTTGAANKLKAVLRFPSGCTSTPIVTAYNSYDVYGNPTSITENATDDVGANGVTSTYAYSEGRVTRISTPGAACGGTCSWNFGYDNGELYYVQFPAGNYEVYCHRSGGSSGCDTDGGTFSQLVNWKAKMSTLTATTFGEKIAYTYWPDGTVKNEQFLTPTEVRKALLYAADAHRRPTFAGSGADGGVVRTARSFDADDNVSGVGLAFNSPPPWCADGGVENPGTSKLCAQLINEPRGYIDTLTQFPDFPTSATPITTRFCWNANGELAAFTPDASTAWAADPTTCAVSPAADLAHTVNYTWDDFGNVIAVTSPDTTNGSDRGTVTLEYDAMNNLVKRQNESQRALGWSKRFTYDNLGRVTAAIQDLGLSGPQTLYSKVYDGPVPGASCTGSATIGQCAPPAGCPSAGVWNGGSQVTNLTPGRVYSVTDPAGTIWFRYDTFGHVLQEIRVRTGQTTCANTNPDTNPHTSYAYTANGDLASIVYPHGRTVTYNYMTTDGMNGRVDNVQATKYSSGSWSTITVAQHVLWEPYGGLRRYEMIFPTSGNFASLEYFLGGISSSDTGAGSLPPSQCPTSLGGSSNGDLTARLREIWLSSEATAGQYLVGGGNGDLYRRTYTWQGDQVTEIDTCYKNQTIAISEGRYLSYPPYDQTLQLKSVSSTNFWNGGVAKSGGPFQTHYINYDSRGNRTIDYTDTFGTAYTSTFASAAYLPDQITAYTGFSAGNDQSAYIYDRDGRVTQKAWPSDSSGDAGFLISPTYENSDNSRAVGDGVLKTVTVNGMAYLYWYDAENRRRLKVYPQGSGYYDEFFYDLGHQLLVDTNSAGATSSHIADEYLWLDGRPIAFFRGSFNSSWARQNDLSGSCPRQFDAAAWNQSAACGLYFLVTDHIGKAVLVLDSSRRVAGTGEYQPNGQPNRLEWRSNNNGINYVSNGTRQRINDWTQPTNGLAENVRAHFTVFDVEAGKDFVRLELPDAGLLDRQTGYHRGNVWTNWVEVPDAGSAQLYLSTDTANCNPNGCGFGSWTYKGAYQREYEYQRYDFGVSGPVYPPLRYPGQYWDPETDFFENWNRYYEPLMGRYLSPDPAAELPGWLAVKAQSGSSSQAYSYAQGNAIMFSDPTGLEVEIDPSCAPYRNRVDTVLSNVNFSLLTTRSPSAVAAAMGRVVKDPGLHHKIVCDDGTNPPGDCAFTNSGVTTLYIKPILDPKRNCLCPGKLIAHEIGHVVNGGSTNEEIIPNQCAAHTSCNGIVGL